MYERTEPSQKPESAYPGFNEMLGAVITEYWHEHTTSSKRTLTAVVESVQSDLQLDELTDVELNNKTDRISAAVEEKLSLEKEWVLDVLKQLLSDKRAVRNGIVKNLQKQLKLYGGMENTWLPELTYNQKCLLQLKNADKLKLSDAAFVRSLLQVLTNLFNEHAEFAHEVKGKRLAKKHAPILKRAVTRRQLMKLGAGAATAAVAGGLLNSWKDTPHGSAVLENAKLIGTRDEYTKVDPAEFGLTDAPSVWLERAFSENTYSLKEYFSYGQWDDVRNALLQFTKLFYTQTYADSEVRPDEVVFTQQLVEEIVHSAEKYSVPVGVALQFWKIASEKFFEIDVYQQEEIPTYTAQTLFGTIGALFNGDSEFMSDIVSAMASRFSPMSSGVGALAAVARVSSARLPMTHNEAARILQPTVGSHDSEVSRYAKAYTQIPAHKTEIDAEFPAYGIECAKLGEAQKKLQEKRVEVFAGMQKLVDADVQKKLLGFNNGAINDASNTTTTLLTEIGLSPKNIDSWQFTHFTRTWEAVQDLQEGRTLPYDPDLLYPAVFDYQYYLSITPLALMGEQFLNNKYFSVLERMFTSEDATAEERQAFTNLARLRAEHAVLMQQLDAQQARTEGLLTQKEYDAQFQAQVGTGFVATLYAATAEALGYTTPSNEVFNRDAQGFMVLMTSLVREITPSNFLITIDSADSIKSPAVDAIFNERKVLEQIKQVIESALRRGLITDHPAVNFAPFHKLLFSLISLNINAQHDRDHSEPAHFDDDEWRLLLNEEFKKFNSWPNYGMYDGLNSSVGYLYPSANEEEKNQTINSDRG